MTNSRLCSIITSAPVALTAGHLPMRGFEMAQTPAPGNDFLTEKLIPITYRAVAALEEWLCRSVERYEGCARLTRDELQSYANEIAYRLHEGKCRCAGDKCARPQQHCLAARPSSGLSLEAFVERAVIGPRGVLANSVEQGMMYPLRKQEAGLSRVLVEFKRCAEAGCKQLYEGDACTRCGKRFDERDTPVLARDWLILEGVYQPVRRWRCGERGTKRGEHFYEDRHQGCPLDTCTRYQSPHPQRGTTLWVRAAFAPSGQQPRSGLPASFYGAMAEGMRCALEDLSPQVREPLTREFGDCWLEMAEAVLVDGQPGLDERDFDLVRERINAALAARGIDEDTIRAWQMRRPGEEEITGNEQRDDYLD